MEEIKAILKPVLDEIENKDLRFTTFKNSRDESVILRIGDFEVNVRHTAFKEVITVKYKGAVVENFTSKNRYGHEAESLIYQSLAKKEAAIKEEWNTLKNKK